MRHKIRKRAQKNNCKDYKKFVNKINDSIRYELHEYINKQIEDTMKKLEIKNGSLLGAVRLSRLKKTQSKKINKLHSTNGIIYDKSEIGNALADNFEQIYYLTENFDTHANNIDINKEYLNIVNKNNLIQPENIAPYEIKTLIKKLNNKKAPGIDSISNLQLKNSTNKVII